MKKIKKIISKKIYLNLLREDDVSEAYLNWLHDREINQFLEVRLSPPKDLKELKEFVRQTIMNDSKYLFGIYDNDKNIHIGNISMEVNFYHRHGSIGLLIGNKNFWGRGIATEAIKLMMSFAYEELKLLKLTAGSYGSNIASIKAFEKVGFKREATMKNYFKYGTSRQDKVILTSNYEE